MTLFQRFDAQHVSDGPHDVGPADDDAERFVRDAAMGDGWLHPRSSNYTFVVDLACDGKRAFGVYKPAKGEAPLWDFPTGSLYRRECASYELAKLLGWDIVPATVVREGEAGTGSLQLFVASGEDANFFTLRESHAEELLRMALFDVIANNADRKGGHCFTGPEGTLWGVDNGLTFHEQGKLRTVIWDYAGERIPEGLLADVDELMGKLGEPGGEAVAQLCAFIEDGEVEALRRRVGVVLENPVMPHAGSRRDLPWPWV